MSVVKVYLSERCKFLNFEIKINLFECKPFSLSLDFWLSEKYFMIIEKMWNKNRCFNNVIYFKTCIMENNLIYCYIHLWHAVKILIKFGWSFIRDIKERILASVNSPVVWRYSFAFESPTTAATGGFAKNLSFIFGFLSAEKIMECFTTWFITR